MGKKYNPEYREQLSNRMRLAKCYCGKRCKHGVHKKCEQLLKKTEGATLAELSSELPYWLLRLRVEDIYPELNYQQIYDFIWLTYITPLPVHLMKITEPLEDDETPDWIIELRDFSASFNKI